MTSIAGPTVASAENPMASALAAVPSVLEKSPLSPIGQILQMYKFYVQFSFPYFVPNPDSHDNIVKVLRNGLDRLAESVPYLAADIVIEDASEGFSGVFRTKPTGEIPLVVKYLRNDASVATMAAMKEAHFPFSMLEETVFSPCTLINIPGFEFGLAADGSPVFAVQVNFIEGGCILTVVAQHNVMDLFGMVEITRLMSKACHNEPFTEEELAAANMDLSKSIKLLTRPYKTGPEMIYQYGTGPVEAPQAPPPATCAYLSFSASSLASLKSLATKTMDSSSEFISTDDALTAFIWQRVTRARVLRHASGKRTTMGRTVEIRKHFGLPPKCVGMLINTLYANEPTDHVVNAPLGAIASQLRSDLDPEVVKYNVRALATLIATTPERSRITFTEGFDPTVDLIISSWAQATDLNGLDFNLGLGPAEAVRKPAFIVNGSMAYLMPKGPDGEIVVAMCIGDEDWTILRADEELTKYSKYIG